MKTGRRNFPAQSVPDIKDSQCRWHRDPPVVNDLGLIPLFKEEDGPEVEEHG